MFDQTPHNNPDKAKAAITVSDPHLFAEFKACATLQSAHAVFRSMVIAEEILNAHTCGSIELDEALAETDTRLQRVANTITKRGVAYSESALVAHIHDVVFGEYRGFTLATDAYQQAGSTLRSALMTGKGSPSILLFIYTDISRRAGLNVEPLATPVGAFARIQLENRAALHIDVTNYGREVKPREFVSMFSAAFGNSDITFDSLSGPLAARTWVSNMLQENVFIRSRNADFTGTAAALELSLSVSPETGTMKRDLGLMYAKLDRKDSAIRMLKEYINENPFEPEAADLEAICDKLMS